MDSKLVVSLYLSGLTQMQVAAKLGIGRKVVQTTLRREGVKCRVPKKTNQNGSLNDNWKGENATKTSKHKRLYRAFGQPKKCDVCGTTDDSKSYDWANLTGDYDNPSDFKRMCRSCHWKYDSKHLNFKGGKKCIIS